MVHRFVHVSLRHQCVAELPTTSSGVLSFLLLHPRLLSHSTFCKASSRVFLLEIFTFPLFAEDALFAENYGA